MTLVSKNKEKVKFSNFLGCNSRSYSHILTPTEKLLLSMIQYVSKANRKSLYQVFALVQIP